MGSIVPPDTATYSVKGKFIPGQAPIRHYGEYFQVGNINGDEYDDLLLSSRVNKIPPPPNPTDSLDMLHIYLGGENFAFIEDGESLKYESRLQNDSYSYGWFKREFSMMDINGDDFSDLIISHYYKDSTNHVHFGSVDILDTIPSFIITDPDTTREDIIVGQTCHDVGDWNNDGENDFLLKHAGLKTFSLHLGGPHLSNNNPYGLRGLLEAFSSFPTKAINCGDQSGDGVKDFVVTAYPYSINNLGYIIIFRGRDDIVVNVDEEGVGGVPSQFYLEQNYPNPFNPSTKIRFTIPSVEKHYSASIQLKVFDILGREAAVLVNEQTAVGVQGTYEITFNADDYNLSSGVYFYQLIVDDYQGTKKMMILK